MRITKTEICAILCTAAMILVCAGAMFLSVRCDNDDDSLGELPLRASVRLHWDEKKLLPGYNYYLLNRFAEQNGMTADISVSRYRHVNLADLIEDNTDVTVMPLEDSSSIGKGFTCITVDSCCLWVFKNSSRQLIRRADEFIEGFVNSQEYRQLHFIFTKTYDPFRGAPRSNLSPYDGIIREQADSLGWDWRLLAAVVYQESHFHIEAGSEKGARGLMQLIPETGKRFGAEDLTDPGQSISAGVHYLKHLRRQFSNVSSSPEELTKLTLAAYNAGAGRIHDCIRAANQQNIDPGTWENLASVIPSMRDSTILDTVNLRCGIFQGYETLAYVDRVLAIYQEFCRMCPNQ